MKLNQIPIDSLVSDPLDQEVSNFLNLFESGVSSFLDDLDEPVQSLAKRVFSAGGKRIRPRLCFHCCVGTAVSTVDLIKASAVIEFVHVATLVHDDILDGASVRRGKSTIHTEIGNHSSILLGDALFSYALELATEFPSPFICRIVSKATRKTCSGEIRQTFCRENFTLTLDEYFKIIEDKTGELFRASCEVGSQIAGFSDKTIKQAGDFGASLGVIYQIFDDLVDSFGNPEKFNKSLGTDFDSGKITLPLLQLLDEVNDSERENLLIILEQKRDNRANREFIFKLFCKYEILEQCIEELTTHISSATTLLDDIKDGGLSSNLYSFLSSFRMKLNKLHDLSTSNFLAV